MINAIDHELMWAINHAEIELHETTQEGEGWSKRRRTRERVGEKIGIYCFLQIYLREEGKGEKKTRLCDGTMI